MKKFLAFLLAILMALSLVACGDEEPAAPPPPADGGGTQTVGLSRGTFEGNVYSNAYLKFQFTKPASWTFSPETQVAALTGLVPEQIKAENFKSTVDDKGSAYDMMVTDSTTGTNICLGYENLSKSLASDITVEQYIEVLEAQFENVSSMTVTFPDTYDTVVLGNSEFTRVICTATMQGVSMSQIYYLSKNGKYMAFMIVTIQSGYTVAQIEAMFQ